MTLQHFLLLVFVSTFFELVTAPQPGLFFWKPRLGLDLSLPITESDKTVILPNVQNVREGLAVLINGYQAGITLLAVCSAVNVGDNHYQNPLKAYYYTDLWRWFLRYMSLVPPWLSGNGGNFCHTHKVWKRRFHYQDSFLPKWLSSLLVFVDKSSWDQELKDFDLFKRYALPAFGKHFRYPKKHFENHDSQITVETHEFVKASDMSEGAPE